MNVISRRFSQHLTGYTICRNASLPTYHGPWQFSFVESSHCSHYRHNYRPSNFKSSLCQIRTICVNQKLYNRDQFTVDEEVNTEESEYSLSDKIESLARDIVDGADSQFGQLGSMSEREVAETMKTLVMNGLPHQALEDIAEFPQVLNRPKRLLSLLQAFKDIGLSGKKLKTMIQNDCAVLSFDKEDLFGAFHQLMALGFTSDIIVEMIVKQPTVVKADLTGVANRIEDLKLLFNTKHTFKLVKNNPQLLFCDLDDVRRKFMYVYNQMGVTQPQMMHTEIFNYPLEHIHARHMFVVRTGFFRDVKEKEKFDNPKLDTIIDTSDATFANKFGKMTELDYLSFKELLLKEEQLIMIRKGLGGKDYSYEDNDELDEEEVLFD